jgi:long-chain acyl-CoA synthetase
MALSTLNDIFFQVIENDSSSLMLERRDGQWTTITAADFGRRVLGVAQGLRAMRVAQGDRIAIISENRPEWTITDFAALLIGAIVVPIFPTLPEPQTACLLKDCRARTAFVSSERQLKKLLAIQAQTAVEHIFIMDAVSVPPACRLPAPAARGRDEEIEAIARAVKPHDLATIIYTSGTTGEPRGAMLTHGNMASNVNESLSGFDLHPGDVSLSFLPLSHITARHVDLTMLNHGVTLAYVPSPERLPEAFAQVRPTIFVGVPRLYDKLHMQVEIKARRGVAHVVYRVAMQIGKRHRAEVLVGKRPGSWAWRWAERVLYAKLHQAIGGRARIFISGGAPLGRELAEWYADMGIRIFEGYGLTETSPVIAVNNPGAHKLGTVGKPLTNVETRIADDGEILVRGPSIFQGYWNAPQDSERVFEDGWFKTGDIGNLDSEGFLSVTDRKKDLIKTSGGKYVAPQPLENALKHEPMIAEAVVFGDRRKFPAVLIHPYFPLLEQWAQDNGVAYASRHELITEKRVQALYEKMVAAVNRDRASFEQLKQVLLIADEFTIESGTLTASMKVRRGRVQERIEDLLREGKIVGVQHRRD